MEKVTMANMVDLNSDLGESFGAYTIGMDEEVIKLVSRLSVLLSGNEIGKDEKDAVMVALNGAYWR